MRRAKTIVISAFAANPAMSSETGIGWSFIKVTAQLAMERGLDVVVVMNLRSKGPVDAQLQAEGLDGVVETIGIDMPPGLRVLKKPQLTRFEYVVWWMLAGRVMRSLEASRPVFLAHHVTFATEVFPTPITAFSRRVFKVWGPIGSAGDSAVYKVKPLAMGVRREALTQALRDRIALLPAKAFGRRVDLVVAQNQAVGKIFERLGVRARVFPNVILKPELERAIDAARRLRSDAEDQPSQALRILSVGHLVPRKRFDLGLQALTHPLLENAHYELLGKPLEGVADSLPALAAELGVSDRVVFRGKLPRDQVLAAMATSDVFFHPSGREGASGVIGEATAIGIPVVCFANTGASSVLEEAGTSGVMIPATADLSVSTIAEALLEAARLPRAHTTLWTEARFKNFMQELIAEGMERSITREDATQPQPQPQPQTQTQPQSQPESESERSEHP
ncbi:glycosyltransferase [Cryobacterium sp. GrIS_2_6]|uniref:glycosyltransferase n=1 Tax=Cryobacterium sp. GrIS_2_6 TaxID=3162785 RepID=UPI002E055C3D|nr:glycosyltransferase [Cryobacterium psychrotolerans]MEC5151138.1 glycosyltransferase involved in cell wall biosynthesis [Cryobacterium psychrotolerans]